MSKKTIKYFVLGGIAVVLMLLCSIGYSVLFNQSRLVEPTDFNTYHFIIQDTPMVLSGLFLFLYVIVLIYQIVKAIASKKTNDNQHTRTISPKLGYLGFAGFMGFSGFLTYSIDHTLFPFIFFTFFGFFGFFYEGKLSNILRDELFILNEKKAELSAYKIGFIILFFMIWLIGMGLFRNNTEWIAIFMVITVSCIYALVLFLSKYLLYRYETKEY
ncbi:DUF3796 domain-containing protein [Anaerorhabdus furcosa]|uniref:DUF3796 domain-containing protein n=1 Tax=Anaerorhabdus furcosa TaxID=118967 RepID=A0A1T4N4H2_9FIRM|nr:DUF3796 domain-containing protein [Anaerorhabdus furcosa]SJZ74143.1 Protein of unknown function [Anaerorhabdus furcosa]